MNSLICSKDKLPDRCEFFSSLKDECINENTCLEYYGSDPCHYFSNPGLSWDSMLEMTDD